MNQDKCFEEMQSSLVGVSPSITTNQSIGRGGYSAVSSAEAAIILVNSLTSNSTNFFSCSLLLTTRLAASRTYLVRDQVYLERHGENFLLKGTYRLHASANPRWSHGGSPDAIHEVAEEVQNIGRAGLNMAQRKYSKSISNIFRILGRRSNKYSAPNAFLLDGEVVTLTVFGKIPKVGIFDTERTRTRGWNDLVDIVHMNQNLDLIVQGADFDSTRNILNFEGLTSSETGDLAWYGQLQFHGHDTPLNSVGEISDLDRRLVNRQINYSDESVYTDYIPDSNLLEEVFSADARFNYALYRIKDKVPVQQSGKILSDWLVDNEIHVSSAIELFRLSDERTIRLSPGVYQLLKGDEGRYSCDLLTYSVDVRNVIDEDYRAIFPSGKIQSLLASDDNTVVPVSHITAKELFLSSEGEETTVFFQSSKKI